MATAPVRERLVPDTISTDRSFFGHPRGLSTLFFSEMWERFSYYGMRGFLVLYMTAPLALGGMGLDTATAASIYGTYTSMVYLMSLPGGWIADRLIGQRRAVLYGGILIAAGHFSLAAPAATTFYLGLMLVVLGTGLLKPNISVIVGQLYSQQDIRRDAAFSIFYMGINLGAFLGPLVTGYLAQDAGFRALLTGWGLDPNSVMALGIRSGWRRHDARLDSVRARRAAAGHCRHGTGARGVPCRGGQGQATGDDLAGRRLGAPRGVRRSHRDRHAASHVAADHRRLRVSAARRDGGVLRLAVRRGQLDAGGARTALHDWRVFHRRNAVLVGVRAGRIDTQSLRRSQHEQRPARQRRVPQQLVAVGQRVSDLRPGASLRVAVGQARLQPAGDADEVRAGVARRRRRVPLSGAGRDDRRDRRRRSDFPGSSWCTCFTRSASCASARSA